MRTTDDVSSVEQALVENLHRQDLTPLEEAAAYQQLIEDFGLTHEQVAERVGKSRSAITNTLRLLGLPPAVQHLLADGQLSAGHARALLGTPDRALQERLARQAVERGLVGARRSRRRSATAASPPAPTPAGGDAGARAGAGADRRRRPHRRHPAAAAGPARAGGAARRRTSTPGSAVQMGAKRGKVTIDFADLEDLERIYRRIAGER